MEDNFGRCNFDGGYYIKTSELRRAKDHEILLYNFYKRPYNIDISSIDNNPPNELNKLIQESRDLIFNT